MKSTNFLAGVLLLLYFGLIPGLKGQSCNTAYLPVQDSVIVYDVVTNTIITRIFTGAWISAVNVSPDGSRVFATKAPSDPMNPDSLLTINTATNTIIARMGLGTANNPINFVLSPDGTIAYIISNVSNTLTVVNTGTNTILNTLNIAVPMGSELKEIAIKPGGDSIYINTGNLTYIINAQTHMTSGSFMNGGLAEHLIFSPDGTKLYLVNWSADMVDVYNTSTNMLVISIPVSDEPYTGDISPDGTRLYIGSLGADAVDVIDATTNTLIPPTIPTGDFPWGIDVSPDGSRIYVGHFTGRNLSVIDAASNTVVSNTVFSNPFFGLGNWFTPACATPPGSGGRAIPTFTAWGVLILGVTLTIFGVANLQATTHHQKQRVHE